MKNLRKEDYEVIISYLVLMNMHLLLNALASFGLGLPISTYMIVLFILMAVTAYGLVTIYGIREKKLLRIAIIINLIHVFGMALSHVMAASTSGVELTVSIDILNELTDNIPLLVSMIVFIEASLTGLLETFAA